MSRASTSFHRISADRKLGFFERLAYPRLNQLNNLFPDAGVDPELVQTRFSIPDLKRCWSQLHSASSPSRKLSDLFWMTLSWTRIRTVLGPIHMFDFGCGSGGYAKRHQAWSGGCLASYTGADIRASPDWDRLSQEHPRVSFTRMTSNDVSPVIPERTNLIVSQSAVEHVEEDLTLFRQLRDHIGKVGADVLQIHLVPARSGYQTYPFHGVRQYTPRTLSRITRLFTPGADAVLVSLGGAACNGVHREWILGARGDRRTADEAGYDRACLEAIETDMRSHQAEPAFYALILDSKSTPGETASPCQAAGLKPRPRSLDFVAQADTIG